MPGWALQGRRLLEMSGKACPRLELGHGTPHGSPFRSLLGRGLVFSLAMGLLLENAAFALQPATAPVAARCESAAAAKAPSADDVSELIGRLGDSSYRVREDATRDLLLLGPEIVTALETWLPQETDPEVRFRLRFVLENLRPPQNAVLVLRSDYYSSGLYAGDVITHINNQRVNSRAELLRRLRPGAMLRVRRAEGPFETLLKNRSDLPVVCDYRAPAGAAIASAVRLYAYGYAEQAYELLRELKGEVPESELPALLYAVIAYTAGDAQSAFDILAEHPDACLPVSLVNLSSSPSALDLAGPVGAPYHLEWRWWTERLLGDAWAEPDTAIHRVLIPAGRYADALQGVAKTWWDSRQQLGKTLSEGDGGNVLAVCAWMVSELDLVSEALRLIEPRSILLRRTPQGARKWIRVRTDAWLPFARGDAQAALDGFYEDARAILQPPGPPPERIIENPQVAAEVAFFLYQFPRDERVADMLAVVNQPDYAALASYAHWMLYAVRPENFELVREHMLAILPNMPEREAGKFALAAALLEYVRQRPDPEVIAAARAGLADAPPWSDKQEKAALITALEHLAKGAADEAGKALSAAGAQPGVSVLRSTAEYLAASAATPPRDEGLQRPLMAVRAGRSGAKWLLLTRARQFVWCDLASGESDAIPARSANWFPGPLNWPWIGKEESSGRLWVYGLRRVIELRPDADGPEFRANIRTGDIPAFDRYVRPNFTALADLAGDVQQEGGEAGELWRDDLLAGREYFADPELPEIGFIRVLPRDARMVQVAFRGGSHLLIDTANGRCWSSRWIAEQLGLATAPRFFAQAVGPLVETPSSEDGRADGAAPGETNLYLFSDAGLLRLDSAKSVVRRIELPGPEPYPALVPESCPYERRDSCWVYCARLPEEGGQVYRLSVGDDRAELLGMVNEALPREYYRMQSRAELRRKVNDLLAQVGVPSLREFVQETEQLLAKYAEVNNP